MTEKKDKMIDLKGANSTMKLGFLIYSAMVVAFILCACVAYAAGDPDDDHRLGACNLWQQKCCRYMTQHSA